MWTELAAFVQANTTESLLITIIGTILVWLYKQFKDMMDRQRNEKEAAIRTQQGLLMHLELTIATMLKQNRPEPVERLNQLLGDYASYLSDSQRKLVRDFYRSFDPGVLRALHALLVHEADKISAKSEKEKEDQEAGWLFFINKLYAPVWPIIFLFLILIYFFWVYEMMQQGTTTWIRFNYFLFGFSFFLPVIFFSAMMVTWYQKNMAKHGLKRWTAMIILILSPALFFIFNRSDISIPVILLQLGLILLFSKLKRPTQIIVP